MSIRFPLKVNYRWPFKQDKCNETLTFDFHKYIFHIGCLECALRILNIQPAPCRTNLATIWNLIWKESAKGNNVNYFVIRRYIFNGKMSIRLIFHIIVWSCFRSKSTLHCPNVNRKVKIYVEPTTYTKH